MTRTIDDDGHVKFTNIRRIWATTDTVHGAPVTIAIYDFDGVTTDKITLILNDQDWADRLVRSINDATLRFEPG